MTWFLVYLAAGSVVGFLAGLLGIGGGMILVPVLAALFTLQNLSPDHIVHLALGTAMASIVFTSGASAYQHYKLGGVAFEVVGRLAPGLLLGSLAATSASGWIPQRHLALAFAVIVYAGAIQILIDRKPRSGQARPGRLAEWAVGLGIGIICGLVSAGGAFLTVPYMLWRGISMQKAIGTAAMISIPLALMGSTGYVLSGWSVPGLPAYAFGFVYVVPLLGLVIGSTTTARYGARLVHRMPVRVLRRIFALLLFVLASRMLLAYW